MIDHIAQASYALAAIAFAAVAVWTGRRALSDGKARGLSVACLGTAAWALAAALNGSAAPLTGVAEVARNATWVGFAYGLWRQGRRGPAAVTIGALYMVLFATLGLSLGVALIAMLPDQSAQLVEAEALTRTALGLIIAAGTLVLIHNLYAAATTDSRTALRLPLAGLAALCFYDLNVHALSYLSRDLAGDVGALRGLIALIAAPAFAVAAVRAGDWTVRLSRGMAFQSAGVAAIGFYLLAMLVVTQALNLVGGDGARMAQTLFVVGASIAALLLSPSPRFRAWFKVKIAKHLFRHRYDYRAEWLRFTETLGKPGSDAPPLGVRIVQAIADMVESPGGILLVPDEGGALIAHGAWQWQGDPPPALAFSDEARDWLARTGRVVELDRVRDEGVSELEARAIPQWMASEHHAWALAPLVHFGRLVGLVLLERPRTPRPLDWEDFDLLKVAGRQVASYLAESHAQETLSDRERFDEFNRRFAFIMHDVKNLVSQLSLLTRNAERHADNPEFRADMIATLKSSTGRMNDLLARLSQHNKGRIDEPRPTAVGDLAEGVARARRGQHPVIVSGDRAAIAMADPQRLEQAITHLVQNAIEASPSFEPVTVALASDSAEVRIEIRDCGTGMNAAFVRDQLFRPFASTKEGGFGIGAYEARALVMGMGGRLEVESREGRGTNFTILLPVATTPALPKEMAA